MMTVTNTAKKIRRRDVAGLSLAAFVTGLGAITLIADASPLAGRWILLACFVLVGAGLAIFDARHHRLPDIGTLPLAAGIFGGVFALRNATGDTTALTNAVLVSAALAGVLFILGVISGLGLGDVKLSLSIGMLLGGISWELPFLAVVAGFFLAVPHAVIGLAQRRNNPDRPSRLAFGPYLVAGTALVGAWTLATG